MIDLKKYEGHSGELYITQSGESYCVRRVADRFILCAMASLADAELHRDAPELLAEVVRLRADLAEAVATVDRLMNGMFTQEDANAACKQARAFLAKHGGA